MTDRRRHWRRGRRLLPGREGDAPLVERVVGHAADVADHEPAHLRGWVVTLVRVGGWVEEAKAKEGRE